MELVNESKGLPKKAKFFKKMGNAVEIGKGIFILAFAMTCASFLLCRVSFLGSFFPCGPALITALMYKNRLNIYLLPVMIVSMLTCFLDGYYVLGDIAATLLCGIAFVMLGRHEWGLLYRSLIAASITVTTNCAYYLGANMLYRFDLSKLIFEAVAVILLSYAFHFFLTVWFTGDKPLNVAMEKIVAVTVFTFTLLLCSSGLGNVFNLISISMVGGLFVILLIGSRFGILAGVTTGAIVGIVMVICGEMIPALIVVLLFGGLAAGFFKGQNRVYTAIFFVGACLMPGLINGYPELTIPIYAPLTAAALLLPIRKKWLDRLNPIEEGLNREEVQSELRIKDQIETTLRTYLKHFEFLANLYSGRKDGRSIMGYQFSGMAHAAHSMLSKVNRSDDRILIGAPDTCKYQIKTGEACYAREGQVSGDSYICKALADDRYIMILSDGMGKGEAAAAESNLAVTTLARLLEVGFDAEAAIKTVNSILLINSEEEIFSTIDMGILDLKSGKLKLFKVGAAATYIKRRDKVAAIKMAALPMGIVDGLRIDYINVRLRPGDQLIMVSDGIIDSCREDLSGQWLTDAIASIKSKDPQTMADLIINRTVENYGLKEKDDLTVLTFRMD